MRRTALPAIKVSSTAVQCLGPCPAASAAQKAPTRCRRRGEGAEETLWQVAKASHRFLTDFLAWPEEDVILMGRSLGAPPSHPAACALFSGLGGISG